MLCWFLDREFKTLFDLKITRNGYIFNEDKTL